MVVMNLIAIGLCLALINKLHTPKVIVKHEEKVKTIVVEKDVFSRLGPIVGANTVHSGISSCYIDSLTVIIEGVDAETAKGLIGPSTVHRGIAKMKVHNIYIQDKGGKPSDEARKAQSKRKT
jgi:hypothetical protein